MKIKLPIIKKDTYLLTYKLLFDALALAILAFTFLLVAEGMLPGIVTQHISFAKVLLAIFILITAIIWIGKKYQITYNLPRLKKSKSLPFLIALIFLLIGNSLLKFALWQNITITIISLVIFYLFYDLFFHEHN